MSLVTTLPCKCYLRGWRPGTALACTFIYSSHPSSFVCPFTYQAFAEHFQTPSHSSGRTVLATRSKATPRQATASVLGKLCFITVTKSSIPICLWLLTDKITNNPSRRSNSSFWGCGEGPGRHTHLKRLAHTFWFRSESILSWWE